VEHSKDYFSGNIFANINIDTDGSLFDTKILVLNGNTAKEWKFIFMGTDYTTGVKSDVLDKDLDASDQVSFIKKGIPAVQLFTGPTVNYHKPTDTYEKIDGPGLVKVATVAKEVLVYLADRENPMPFTGKGASSNKSSTPKAKTNRRVSTGSMPDFAFRGEGVKIASVMEGSAGDKAGLQAKDIILGIDGKETKDLKAYSDLLKTYKPGDTVKMSILRGEEKKIISLTLGER
jgi:membrane-associated protease RseP (regulator of RpoE activity)